VIPSNTENPTSPFFWVEIGSSVFEASARRIDHFFFELTAKTVPSGTSMSSQWLSLILQSIWRPETDSKPSYLADNFPFLEENKIHNHLSTKSNVKLFDHNYIKSNFRIGFV